ncbi:MAG TPA: Gfo/Idh/MocA family oxidoreductase [Pilimelia sp.]|nr:Gfo/Idh/MocA family oxidoreductase [Pilimelia sp.]
MNLRATGGFTPVIVGYGRAGRDLHHASLRAIAGHDPTVFAVDPARPSYLLPGAVWVSTVHEAVRRLGDPARAVFHVATPVATHRGIVERLVDLGATRIVLEKPIAASAEDARQILGAVRRGVTVLPVGVWLSSSVTEHLEKIVAAGTIGTPVELHMEQSKPRFGRSARADAHTSAIQVELPHQLLLALHLAGQEATVAHAAIWPMELEDGRTIPRMGGATVTLRHAGGTSSRLVSDLTAPMRVRRLRLSGSGGEIVAHYPVSGDDDMGQLRMPGQAHRTLVRDAPVTRFLTAAYGHFAGICDPPPGDLNLHLRVAELLEQIATQAETADRDEVVRQ